MPSWFARQAVEATGPASGTPAAAIQEHYMAAIRAGARRDAEAQLVERDRMLQAAKSAGFAEVVAAMDRYMLALGDSSMEPPEIAVKAITLSVDALPFRPRPGTVEGRLLDAWAEWDMAVRHTSDDYKARAEAFIDAIKAAQAQKVLAALMLFMQASNGLAMFTALGAVGLKVYQAAYHRDPPSKEAFGF